MTAELLAPPGLRGMDDDALAAMYTSGSDEERAAVLAECGRRDEAAARRRHRASVRAVSTEWAEISHAQFTDASRVCAGRLLSRRGMEQAEAEWPRLWTVAPHVARAWASEELNNYWDEHPRITPGGWQQQQKEAVRMAAGTDELDALAPGDTQAPLAMTTMFDAMQPVGAATSAADAAAGALADERDAQSMAQVAARPMIPLDLGGVPLTVPRGDVTLAYGKGSVGKGRLTHALIAEVTRAGGDVIIIAPEDKPDEQIRPRLDAAGADPDHVWNLTRLPASTSRFKLSADMKQEGHLPHLRAFTTWLQERGRDPRLVVIDPVAAAVGWGTINTNRGARALVEPLQDYADTTGVSVWVIAHETKDGKLQGSEGLRDALRVIYHVTVDGDNPAYRVVSLEKGNNLPPDTAQLRFTISSEETGQPRVVWLSPDVVEAQRVSWRDRAAGGAPPAAGGGAGPFEAGCATRSRSGAVESHGLGTHPGEQAAKHACQTAAEAPLTWHTIPGREGFLAATVKQPDGTVVSYAVAPATAGK